jgi:hypothetical protein
MMIRSYRELLSVRSSVLRQKVLVSLTLPGKIASPIVAGVAAYLLSLDRFREQLQVPGQVAKQVKELVQSLAYPRLPDGPIVVFNSVNLDRASPSASVSGTRKKRQEGGVFQSPAPATSAPAKPTDVGVGTHR